MSAALAVTVSTSLGREEEMLRPHPAELARVCRGAHWIHDGCALCRRFIWRIRWETRAKPSTSISWRCNCWDYHYRFAIVSLPLPLLTVDSVS